MPDWTLILLALAAVILAAFTFNLYRVQKSALVRVLHLIAAYSQRQYGRRITDSSIPGAAGELARATNTLAEALEARSAQAQFDSDHLLSLLAVLDHTNEIAIATDSTDNIRLANPAAARLLGRPADELLGKQLDTVVTHPELLALYRNAFRTTKPISTQVTLQAPGGAGPNSAAPRTLHCQATAATIYNGAHYRGTLLLLRDVTEVARTLQIKTDFVANASHELRTPLASILAAVETVKESTTDGMGIDNAVILRCVDIIDKHAHRLEMIITDLLDLSRAEDPRAAVRSEKIDVAHVAEQVIGMLSAAAAEKHVQLRLELADDARSLQGDERLLNLILKNLVDNAVKFTAAGTVTIRSFNRPEDNTLILEVEDTGCGISPEDQQRVFERFYTVNRSRGGADRGTGLGLAIVKHATAAMGGQVSLTSRPGQGTTLRCAFPRTAGTDGAQTREDTKEHLEVEVGR